MHEIFRAAGADWREPGCSMCLAMNPDKLAQGERSASTSNRNFEGRQGRGGRTHLVSPAVAAATAVAGHFATPEDLGARMKAVHVDLGHGRAAAAQRRRHRSDHPRRVAEARRAHRLREGPVLDVARRPQLRAQRRALRRRIDPRRRPGFGVGSSREHAVWAIQQGGFDAVIAPSFSDIFRNNCTKNGLVPVVLPEATVEAIWAAIEADPATEIIVDVERLIVEVPAAGITARVPDGPADATPLPRRPRRRRHHPDPRRRDRPTSRQTRPAWLR